MYRMWNNFDAWKVFDSGVSMMDDDDTRELERVGEDDETVEAVSDSHQLFKIFAVPRLARMKDMVALVLIGSITDGYKLVVWYDGRLWHTRRQYLQESGADIKKLYTTMQEVVDAMYEANPTPSATVWQMRQLTQNGVFDTAVTQDWNQHERD